MFQLQHLIFSLILLDSASAQALQQAVFPDIFKVNANLAQGGPRMLRNYSEVLAQQCPEKNLSTIQDATSRLKELPDNWKRVCLFPVLYREREQLVALFRATESPVETRDEWTPVELRAGWWNARPFLDDAVMDPAVAISRYLILTEALRRSLLELKPVIKGWTAGNPATTANSITLPMAISWLEGSSRLQQSMVFHREMDCRPQQKACQQERARLAVSVTQAWAGVKKPASDMQKVLEKPASGIVPYEVETVREAIRVDGAFRALRSAKASALELVESLDRQGLLSKDIARFRAALFDWALIPKDLEQTALLKALTAGIVLAEIKEIAAADWKAISEASAGDAPSEFVTGLTASMQSVLQGLEALVFSREGQL